MMRRILRQAIEHTSSIYHMLVAAGGYDGERERERERGGLASRTTVHPM